MKKEERKICEKLYAPIFTDSDIEKLKEFQDKHSLLLLILHNQLVLAKKIDKLSLISLKQIER